jgi:hypothetical protein
MNISTIYQQLRDQLSDDGDIIDAAELNRIIDLAVIDYSEYAPLIEEYALVATPGVFTYTLPADTFGVLAITDPNLLNISFYSLSNTVRFLTDPGVLTYTVILQRVHQKQGAAYPTIPARHLTYVTDFALAYALYRIADDVARRPSTTEGQTSVDFGNSALNMTTRADSLRKRTQDRLFDASVFTG